jgi:toxin HigB-1
LGGLKQSPPKTARIFLERRTIKDLIAFDITIESRYYLTMIKTFGCRETEKIFNGSVSAKLPKDIQRTALRKLTQIHGAATLEFLRVPPANRLEKLGGDRKGQWSIRINDRWRICFRWHEGHAFNVEIIDYH